MASLIDSQRSGSFGLAKLGDGVRANSDAKTQAGLGRGAGEFKKLVNAAWTNTFPAQGATLDLDFANDRGFVRGVGQGRSMDAVTFTRASNGTFVKPDGTLGQHSNQGALGNNLLTFPQDFENSAWTGTTGFVTVTPNTSLAPDDTNTSDTLLFSDAAYRYQQVNTGSITGKQYTFSVWVWTLTGKNTIGVRMSGITTSSDQVFTLVNLTTTPTRIEITRTFTSADTGIFAGFDNRTGVVGGLQTTGSIQTWGAQLELGSTATQYFPTNINTPRFDWSNTTRSTYNTLRYSNDFTQSVWIKGTGNPTVTANALSTSIGSMSKFIAGTANGTQLLLGQGQYIKTNMSFSVYAKAAERSIIGIVYMRSASAANLPPSWYEAYDLSTGLKVQTSSVGNTSYIEFIGDGIYRITCTPAQEQSAFPFNIYTPFIGVSNGSTFNYAGNGTDGIYIANAQVQEGKTSTAYLENGVASAIPIPLQASSTCNGLLSEDVRANVLLWCRDATQTNWTKTNVTVAKDQTGIDGVANACSSLTATADNGTCIQTFTATSSSRTSSVYLKRITGTGAIQVTMDGTTYSTVDLSNGLWNRIALEATVTNPTVGIKLSTSGDVVAMDFAQIEVGSATSPILTTTASVTRSADVATIPFTTFNNAVKGGEYTLYSSCKLAYISGGRQVTVNVNTNLTNNIEVSNNRTYFATIDNFQVGAGVQYTAFDFNIQTVIAVNQYDASVIGGGVVWAKLATNVNTSRIPLVVNIGSLGGNNSLNGYLSQVTYFQERITNDAAINMTGRTPW